MAFTVHQINAGMDNTFYLAGDPGKKEGVLIDPFDGESALRAVEQSEWRVQAIINTHGHWDHVGGNDAVRERFGVPIFAHPLEEVPHAQPISENVILGSSTFRVLHTPGHRPGHICLLGEGCLFTGDTLFVAGCGNPKFGGNVDQLFESFKRLATLDESTWIYPGHNYASKNLLFSATWEPDNAAVAEGETHFTKASLRGEVHRSKLVDEKRWNLFFRLHSPALRERLVAEGKIVTEADDRTVFHTLRELRNSF
jgi:hydroxyacylglutathione hydrolase